MRVAIPHNLGKEEVRNRLKARSHEIGEQIPGGMAEVTTNWESEYRLSMRIATMGQEMLGTIEIEESELAFEIDLPMALSFIKPMVESAIRDKGQKLLA